MELRYGALVEVSCDFLEVENDKVTFFYMWFFVFFVSCFPLSRQSKNVALQQLHDGMLRVIHLNQMVDLIWSHGFQALSFHQIGR